MKNIKKTKFLSNTGKKLLETEKNTTWDALYFILCIYCINTKHLEHFLKIY